jgi:hypothetical protein
MPEFALSPPESILTTRFAAGVRGVEVGDWICEGVSVGVSGVAEGGSGVGEGVTGVGEGVSGVGEGVTGVGEGGSGVGEGVTGVTEGVTGVTEGVTGVTEGVTGVGVGVREGVRVLVGVELRTGVLDGCGVKVPVGLGGRNGRYSLCPALRVVSFPNIQLANITSCWGRFTSRLSRNKLSPGCTTYTTHPAGGPQAAIVRVGLKVALEDGVKVSVGVGVEVGRGGRARKAPSTRNGPDKQFPAMISLSETPRCAARSLNLSPGWILYRSHPCGTAVQLEVGVGVTMTGLKVGIGVEDGSPGSGVSWNTGRVTSGWAVGTADTKPSVIATRIAPRTIRLVRMPEIKPTDTSFRLFMTPGQPPHPSG